MKSRAIATLDASAVLAWILQEPGYQTIDKIIRNAAVPASAMTEVLYRARERGNSMPPEELHTHLTSLGVHVEPVTSDDVVRAATLIQSSREAARTSTDKRSLSLGDGLCIAVAERLALPLTGGDEHWETVTIDVPYLPFR
ncbi:MAG: PIN domain-containing protein [Actinomycetes bacterium]